MFWGGNLYNEIELGLSQIPFFGALNIKQTNKTLKYSNTDMDVDYCGNDTSFEALWRSGLS